MTEPNAKQRRRTVAAYAHPEMLASARWVEEHLYDPNVRVVEVGWNTTAFDGGHIPGAVNWLWAGNVLRANSRDILGREELEAQLSRAGVDADTIIVIYDSFSNLLAAMALWMLKIYGHPRVRLLDGERTKWIAEGRPLTSETPAIKPTVYTARQADWTLRAHRDVVLSGIGSASRQLVDARTTAMYNGEDASGASVAGHIPGAINVPAFMEMENGQFRRWVTPTTNPDGTFKSAEELQAVFKNLGTDSEREIITYCVRGGLSTHLWFALKYLLGYPFVREYDGSWAEWGNLVDAPIEKA